MTPVLEIQELLEAIKSIRVLLFSVKRVSTVISCFWKKVEHNSFILEMLVYEVRPSIDKDFDDFFSLVVEDEGWIEKYNKGDILVKSKWTEESRIKMIKVSSPINVSLECLYDVLHDPEYRKVWDKDMTDSYDVCKLNGNTVIGWYGAKMPPPLKYRDWSLYRTWRKDESEFMIFNHSVDHKLIPVRKNYVRSVSYLTGYFGEKLTANRCKLTFITQTDPKGKLPKWFINLLSTSMSPRIMKKLHKTALKYEKWKNEHNPEKKPWLTDGDNNLPLLNMHDVINHDPDEANTSDEIDETFISPDSNISDGSDYDVI
ncbi:START domain-containing protein 10-like [Hydractinia symbiolongicarpus]|uniref:START domain-containing protein 10-like n=1 Tax=Hydractinia symbiolongicarpus TaxID=13093 RepID=UPI00254BBB9C|nr:START domain-containing protein 10-like [Hydractinia symbiolongicarpus]